MYHKIKLQENFCDAVLNKEKTFEIRYNDRGYQKGDKILFVPVDKNGIKISHPVEKILYEITYVINGWGLENGYVVFSIREIGVTTEEFYADMRYEK